MNKLQKLKNQRSKISEEINKIEELLEKEAIPQFLKYIGKCYKYPNSDGMNKFWTYFQIQEIEDVHFGSDEKYSVSVAGIEFDDCVERDVAISKNHTYLHLWLSGTEISSKEFCRKYSEILSKLGPI